MEYTRRGQGLEAFAKGEVVLLDFPFSDHTGSKIRPALVVQTLRDDAIIVPITTNTHRSEHVVFLDVNDFAKGGLRELSLARTDFLLTCHKSLFTRKIGAIRREKLAEVVRSICAMLDA